MRRVFVSLLAALGLVAGLVGPAAAGAARPQCSTADGPKICYTPAELRVAYGVAPLADRGVDGAGRSVVLFELAVPDNGPEAATDIREDLTAFDSRFGLPPVDIETVADLAAPGTNRWAANGEEVLDAEMAHAMAPAARLVVLLVSGTTLDLYATALNYTVDHDLGDVVSISSSVGEHCFTSDQVRRLHAATEEAAARHVTVIGSSGDYGAVGKPCPVGGFAPVKEVGLPAADPLVTSAGGTSLDAGLPDGRYLGETAWNTPPTPGPTSHSNASGGGFSTVFARPGYQRGVARTAAGRGVPDVASDADPAKGVAVAEVVNGQTLVGSAGGTSAAAPMWAGLTALADQNAHRRLGFLNAGLYRIASRPLGRLAFHDVTAGDNTVDFPPERITGYQAGPGWDPVTGWGSPNASVLVPLLGLAVHSDDGTTGWRP